MKKPAPTVEPVVTDATSMTDARTLHTVQSALQRIEMQQQHINHLLPKVQAWDVLCTVVGALTPSQPYGTDSVVGDLRDLAAALHNRIANDDRP